ncbi:MAG: hypothetical protein DRG20_00285 [Deltaproteobacteria bacterium]|nr:MAG: hypothetical protein DRG20_00285 [Deltaproteobacteria bacterium]
MTVYENYWITPWIYRISNIYTLKYCKKASSLLPTNIKNIKVVDIGTGLGNFANVMEEKGYKVFAIDSAMPMIKMARKILKNKKIKWIASDMINLPFKDATFDISCSSFAIHNLTPKKMKQGFLEMVRVSKKYIILIEHSMPKNPIHKWLMKYIEAFEKSYYYQFLSQDLRKWFKDNSLIIENEINLDGTNIFLLKKGHTNER